MSWQQADLDALLPPDQNRTRTRRSRRTATKVDALLPTTVPSTISEYLLGRVGEAPSTVGEKRSGQTFSLVMKCIESNWQPGQTLAFLLDRKHRPSLAKFSAAGLPHEVAAIYGKHPHVGRSCLLARCGEHNAPAAKAAAVAYAPSEPTVLTLARILASADASPWPGMAGKSARALLEGHVSTAEQADSLQYNVSVRDLGLAARVNRKTVSNRQPDLVNGGWLVVDGERCRRRDAASYRLCVVEDGPYLSQRGEVAASRTYGPTSARADFFRYGKGAGKTAETIYAALESSPCTRAEVVQAVGCCDGTARKQLRRMLDLGLVKEVDGVWHAVEVEWDAHADNRGVLGAGLRQQDLHARERRAYDQVGRLQNVRIMEYEQILMRKEPALAEFVITGVEDGWEVAKALVSVERQARAMAYQHRKRAEEARKGPRSDVVSHPRPSATGEWVPSRGR